MKRREEKQRYIHIDRIFLKHLGPVSWAEEMVWPTSTHDSQINEGVRAGTYQEEKFKKALEAYKKKLE